MDTVQVVLPQFGPKISPDDERIARGVLQSVRRMLNAESGKSTIKITCSMLESSSKNPKAVRDFIFRELEKTYDIHKSKDYYHFTKRQ